ncbi:ankyrin repeat protein, putative, partial [Bodo saltans]
MSRCRAVGLLCLVGVCSILLLTVLQDSPVVTYEKIEPQARGREFCRQDTDHPHVARGSHDSAAQLQVSSRNNATGQASRTNVLRNEELRNLLHDKLPHSNGGDTVESTENNNNKKHVVPQHVVVPPRIAPSTISKQANRTEDRRPPVLRDGEVPEEEDSERDIFTEVVAANRKDGPLLCSTTWHPSPADPDDLDAKHNRQGCHHRQSISCTGKRLGRAIVIYMLQTKNIREMNVEMQNFNYFMNVGVFGEHERTEMFEGVDYIFTRMMPRHLGKVAVPTIIAEKGNIKLMWVPPGPCDLCAHGRVITHLGGVDAVKANYSFIVLLNGGARGPFQAANDATWIDVMAIGGQATWSESTPPIMVGPSVSTQFSVHVQTHTIALHTRHLAQYFPFLTQCSNASNGKAMCIRGGEVPAGIAWLRGGGWIHGLLANVTLRSPADADALAQTHKETNIVEPMKEHYDLCSALFTKFGGTFTNVVRPRTAVHAAQLIVFQPISRALSGRALLQELLGNHNFMVLGDQPQVVPLRKDEGKRNLSSEHMITIVHAWYGVQGRIEDDHNGQVVERLRANIEQSQDGRLVVTGNLNHFFGFDPAPNEAKIAAIHLRYKGKDHHFQLSEGQTLEFPKADVKGHDRLQCSTTWHPSPDAPDEDLDFKHDYQGCHHRQSISCTGKRLRRALVIYMLQTKNIREMNVEMQNFDYFMNSGVFGEHESTEMFEGVDYIFTRMTPRHLGKVAVPTVIAEKGNIKLMWVPPGPCD